MVVKLSRPAVPRVVRASLLKPVSDIGYSTPVTIGTGCFPRCLRLLSAAEFKAVFADANKVGDKYLTLLARMNERGHPRLGMAISRKSVRRAVARNRIKRQLREYVRLHQEEIGSLDLVVLCKPGVEKLDKRAIRDSINACFERLAKRSKTT